MSEKISIREISSISRKNEVGFNILDNRKLYCIHIYKHAYIRECGEMDDRSDDSVCQDGQREIVYAWAMDADSRALPEGE